MHGRFLLGRYSELAPNSVRHRERFHERVRPGRTFVKIIKAPVLQLRPILLCPESGGCSALVDVREGKMPADAQPIRTHRCNGLTELFIFVKRLSRVTAAMLKDLCVVSTLM
jgi:hypothetical protein